MTRLLHAAARGARIERRHFKLWCLWESSRVILVTDPDKTDSDYDYRIHPADEHLQYGPISTALREMAEDDSWNPSEERALALSVARQFQVYFGDEPDYPLFYLFLAEALADEGM